MIIPQITPETCESLSSHQFWWLRGTTYVGNDRPIDNPEQPNDAYVLEASAVWLNQFDDFQACADQLNELFARYSTDS